MAETSSSGARVRHEAGIADALRRVRSGATAIILAVVAWGCLTSPPARQPRREPAEPSSPTREDLAGLRDTLLGERALAEALLCHAETSPPGADAAGRDRMAARQAYESAREAIDNWSQALTADLAAHQAMPTFASDEFFERLKASASFKRAAIAHSLRSTFVDAAVTASGNQGGVDDACGNLPNLVTVLLACRSGENRDLLTCVGLREGDAFRDVGVRSWRFVASQRPSGRADIVRAIEAELRDTGWRTPSRGDVGARRDRRRAVD